MDCCVCSQVRLNFRQLGFREGVGTREVVGALPSVVSSCKKKRKALLAGFVDFSKAFGTVLRAKLIQKLRNEGVSVADICMICEM
mmetsp:Transcript_31450/g.62152  ORF Transcript_31450/g.62152 Transcript_31450/m.62152 type:complete len:85 (-) Transcript_31450:454-708(-)